MKTDAVSIAERLAELRKAVLHWHAPFRYEPEATMIVDRKGNRILDVRGWGYLTGTGAAALNMSDQLAEPIQDAIGYGIADFLNNPY
jgi:hypothetical protein